MSAITINTQNIKRILGSRKPVLIDFWAPWCGPCRLQAPIIDEISRETRGLATIAKLNIEEQPELATKYAVVSIPTLLLLHKGKIIARKTGVTSKEKLLSMLGTAAS
jgi:thioredoxin 1